MTQHPDRHRSPVLVLGALLVMAALLVAACNPDADRSPSGPASAAPGGGASPTAAGSQPAEGSQPAGTAATSGEPAASPGGGQADISGDLLVGAVYAEGDDVAKNRYDVFLEQYPDVNTTFTEAQFDPQAFLTAVASGDAPDVVQMDRNIIGTYISQGALEPLDQCITDHGIDMSQYREAAVAQVTFDGQVWGIPQFFNTDILMINQSVLDEVGLTPEDIDTSDWDKLAQVNEQMMAKDGNRITRIGFDPKLPELLPLWAGINGASIISEDGMTSQLDDPAVAEALDFAAGLVLAHGSAADFFDFRGTSATGRDLFSEQTLFTEDELGAFPYEQFYLNVMANNTPDEAVAFQPVKDRQGNNITLSGGSAWVVTSSSENKEAACEWAKVVTSPDTWYRAAQMRAEQRAADGEAFTGVYTANTAADERIFSDLVTEESARDFYDGVQLVVETADSAITLPPNPAAEQFTRVWQEAVQRVLNEGVPAQDALADAHQEAQDAIDSAR